MLQSMDDVDLTSPKTKSEMEKYLDEILKRARKAEEEPKKQAQPRRQPVAGSLAGSGFFYNDISPPPGENKTGNGVNTAPPAPHKSKLDLNEIYT